MNFETRMRQVPGTDDVYQVDGWMWNEPGNVAVYIFDTPQAAVVDTGTAEMTPKAVSHALDTLGIGKDDLAHIVPTHVHLDHAGGAGTIAHQYAAATVHCHHRGIDFLTDPGLLGRLQESVEAAIGEPAPYGVPERVPPNRASPLADGDTIDLGDRSVSIVEAPGHAPHQVCVFDSSTGALCTADAAGMWFADRLYPTTPPPSFDLSDSLVTIERLSDLEPAVNCYPHFGTANNATAKIREFADLLPEWVSAVETAAEKASTTEEIYDRVRPEWESMGFEADVRGILQYLDRIEES